MKEKIHTNEIEEYGRTYAEGGNIVPDSEVVFNPTPESNVVPDSEVNFTPVDSSDPEATANAAEAKDQESASKYGTTGQKLKTFAEHTASSGTFGLSTKAERLFKHQ